MKKNIQHFIDGIISAFVTSPRAAVGSIQPAMFGEYEPVGNAARHWEKVGVSMGLAATEIHNGLDMQYNTSNQVVASYMANKQ